MFRKQTKKFILTSLLGLILFSLLPISGAKAQTGCNITVADFNQTSTLPVLPAPKFQVSKSKVTSGTDPFDAYFEAFITPGKASSCTADELKNFEISIYSYDDDWGVGIAGLIGAYNDQVSYPVSYDPATNKFSQRVRGLTLAFLQRGSTLGSLGDTNRMYAYFHKKNVEPANPNYVPPNGVAIGTGVAATTTTLPDIPGVTAQQTTVDNNVVVDYKNIKSKIVANSNGKGLRAKYRVKWSDTEMAFGSSSGLDGVHMEWEGTGINNPQQFSLPAKDDGTQAVDFSPYYNGSTVYFGYFSDLSATKVIACKPGWLTTSCPKVFRAADSSANGDGSPLRFMPNDYTPKLLANAWKSKISPPPTQDQLTNKKDGVPLGSVDFAAIPSLIGTKSSAKLSDLFILTRLFIDDTVFLLSGSGELKKFTVEVYANDEDIKEACKKDSTVTDKTKCDNLAFAQYAFADTITQTTNPNEAKAATASQTLYHFIVRIISVIITFLQQVIFWIFATILVPVIKALLSVRPYEDAFVNVIYPGWLILRNLSNIFFIVALLVVGMKILFQQSPSSTAMSFIRRLLIMALLVNFSLVIGQGIVGIADTVQSQFLPAESKVIEALGAKLMVEPLKVFRSEVIDTSGGQSDGGEFTASNAELSLADTLKPLVLLILAVAAFWSFVALAAFLLVRLVVLWILYMVSPIAYVGFVMEETRGYASRWWKEFLKYAMMTPILAFFLNIAALMATAFAGSQNQGLFKAFSDGSLSADLVVNIITFISHFFVLIVLFAGMKFAMSSGTVGARAITNFAQKGFKKTFSGANGIKDGIINSASKGLSNRGYTKSANFLTAAAKPVDYLKAVKKAQIDDRTAKREKEVKERIAGTFGARGPAGDTSKLGSSLKKPKELAKDFEGDDAPYLTGKMEEAKKKGNKDLMAGAVMKMGQEGHFKDLLDAGKKLTGRAQDYSQDAAGLNEMTEDMVKKGMITQDNRRDLLREFDLSAKKKRKNSHFGGNLVYDEKSKKYTVRKREESGVFENDTYRNKDSYLRGQIKARSGDDAKGSLKTDLTQASEKATLEQRGDFKGEFSKAQIGVFAEQTEANLDRRKTWVSAEEANSAKYESMQKAVDSEAKRERMRGNMEEYLKALYKEKNDREADGEDLNEIRRSARAKVDIISRQLNQGGNYRDNPDRAGNEGGDNNNGGNDGNGGGNAGGNNGYQPNNYPGAENDDAAPQPADDNNNDEINDDDDDDDDETPQANADRGSSKSSSKNRTINNTVIAQTAPGPGSVVDSAQLGVAHLQDQPILGQTLNSRQVEVGRASGYTSYESASTGKSKSEKKAAKAAAKAQKRAANDNVGGNSGALRNRNRAGFINDTGKVKIQKVNTQRVSTEPEWERKLGDTNKKYDTNAGSVIPKPQAAAEAGSNISGNLGGDQVFGSRPVDIAAPAPRPQPQEPAVPETPKAIDFDNKEIKDETTGGTRRRAGFNVGKVMPKTGEDIAPGGVSRLFPDKKDDENKPVAPVEPPADLPTNSEP